MSAVAADKTAHAHLRRAFKETFGDQAVCFGDAGEWAGDGQHAVVDALDDLADSSAHARLIS